jgi:hypothetical protein
VRDGFGLVWVVCPVRSRICRASLSRLRCFLWVFVLMVCVILSQRRGGLREVARGLRVLWEDEVKECRGHFVCVGIDLFSFMFRSIMTRIMASSEDIDMLVEFLEGARLVFLTVHLGASMAHVNSLFWSLAAMGRRTLSAGVWVVPVRGRYRRSVRLQRWAQRQLLILREVVIARCVRVVTGSAEI